MTQLGKIGTINGIIVDEFLLDGWPVEFSGCWIGIRKDSLGRTAFLVESSQHQESLVVEVSSTPEGFVASISWDILYRFQTAYVDENRRGNGMGFILARWARAWVAKTEGKKIRMPWYKNRTPETQDWIDQWESLYNDPDVTP